MIAVGSVFKISDNCTPDNLVMLVEISKTTAMLINLASGRPWAFEELQLDSDECDEDRVYDLLGGGCTFTVTPVRGMIDYTQIKETKGSLEIG